jgi:transposase InsO family protein
VRVDAATKAEVLKMVAVTQTRSRWSLGAILSALGVTRSVYFEWRCRAKQGRLQDTAPVAPRLDALLPDEERAIIAFALQQPKVGYRKLTWMMVDQGIAFASESAVYRVLNAVDLLSRWKRSERSSGEYRYRPTAPNQQWHTDVMYVWVGCRHYFLLNFVDAFSRYVVHHRLLIDLNGQAVATELEAALSKTGAIRPRIVHDHGSEFVNRDLHAVIKQHNLIDIRTRARHPESNGIVERFNGTVRDETSDRYGDNYLQACASIDAMITHYNDVRLHAALGYIEPREAHFGDLDQRRALRTDRLAAARELRRQRNRALAA